MITWLSLISQLLFSVSLRQGFGSLFYKSLIFVGYNFTCDLLSLTVSLMPTQLVIHKTLASFKKGLFMTSSDESILIEINQIIHRTT